MRKLLEDAAERSIRYLEHLDERPVAPDPAAVRALEGFVHPLPERGLGAAATLAQLDELGSPATMAIAGRRFFGFVIGGSLPVTLAANWLAGAWDQNAVLYNPTPGVAVLEQVALDWLVDLFGLPAGTGGGFVTGATMANFAALAAARHTVLKNAGWDVEADGLIGAPPVTVIVGQEVHPSVVKALGMLGFGRSRLQRVPVDGQGRLMAAELPAVDGPTIVCLQAGNVNTGAFDPIGEVCDRLAGRGAWVHVDGAFGLWAAAVPELRPLIAGVERADSWGTDAHKWLNVPYDSGLAFVRHPDTLRAAMAVTAEYLPASTTRRDPADYTPELSRRARGVEVWAALNALGKDGVAELVRGCCRHARRFAEGLSAAGFQILNEVGLNQVLVSFGDADANRRMIAAIQEDGTLWAGPTVWQGQPAMRISVSSWATTDEDVALCLERIIAIGRGLAGYD